METRLVTNGHMEIFTPVFAGNGCLKFMNGKWYAAAVKGELTIYGIDQDKKPQVHFRTESTSFVVIPNRINHG
jgi:hypothetical protein